MIHVHAAALNDELGEHTHTHTSASPPLSYKQNILNYIFREMRYDKNDRYVKNVDWTEMYLLFTLTATVMYRNIRKSTEKSTNSFSSRRSVH